jgi:transglutaminase-like putative cysteine protease
MLALADGRRGAQSLELRQTIERIIRDIEPRDKLSQLAAIYNWFNKRFVYVHDPVPSELVCDPLRVLEQISETGKFLGDCDDAATFLVGSARSIGIRAAPIRVGFRKPRTVTLGTYSDGRPRRVTINTPFTHVLAVARDQYGQVIAVDPVAGKRTYRMLRRTKRFG